VWRLRILVIHTSDWLGHPVPSRLHRIFELLAEHDDVYVPRFNIYSEIRRNTKAIVYEINDFKINRLAEYYIINAPKHYKAIKGIAEENQIEVAVISNLLTGYITTKALGNRIATIFDLADHFPSTAAGYYFQEGSALGNFASFFLERILAKTLHNVQYTVTCSHILQDYVRKLHIKDVSVISNGVDDFFFQKFNGSKIRQELGIEKDLIVGYIGCIEFYLDMLPLLKAIKRLDKYHNVKLLLVGSRLRTKTVEKVLGQIKRLGIEKNVIWLDFVPYRQVPGYIAAMDICTIPFDLNYKTAYYSAPIKLLEYLALGKPVLTTSVPEIRYMAKEYVHFVKTEQDYMMTIEQYMKQHDEYLEHAQRGKELARQFLWSKIAREYRCLLETAIEHRSGNS
jgi:glycosyltransferase involved in cell wall biosynthesis